MDKSLTIIIPAYNEEKFLAEAIRTYDRIARSAVKDYEIIVINDGSSDRTGEIADAMKKQNPRVRVVHNKGNKGLGYNYGKGVELARKNYVTMVPAEAELLFNPLRKNFLQIGKADIIIPYLDNKDNSKVRPFHRRIVSSAFTFLLNTLFGLHLRYYNAHVIHQTKVVRKVKMSTNSFAYQAEILIRLLKGKKKYSYIMVPYETKKAKGRSSCMRVKNLIGVARTIIRLFFDIYFNKNRS
jgi:dolichol-phosphate mannosyltransferase